MSINRERMRRKKEDMQRRGSGGLFRPKEGKNIIRVFLFDHKVTKSDIKNGFYDEDDAKVGKTVTEVDREVAKHFFEGGHGNCDGKSSCPACADARKLLGSGNKTDAKTGRMLNPRVMHHINLVDMQDKDSGVQLGSLPKTAFEPILDFLLDDEDGGEDAFGISGVDFIITKDKSKRPSEQYSVRPRDRSKCKSLDDSLLEDVKDLMTISDLDPGFNMDDYSREFDDDEENEEKKEDEEETKKDDGGDDEGEEFIGKTVKFKGDKKMLKGVVKEVDEGIALVVVGDDDEWEVEIGELKVIK